MRAAAGRLGLRIVGHVATHYHFDHIGGAAPFGLDSGEAVPGLREYAAWSPPIAMHINDAELAAAAVQTGVGPERLSPLRDGDTLRVGNVTLEFLHTPGHSPGSMVMLVRGADGEATDAVTGDTLFPGSCGRVDLPGSDPSAMWRSLQHVVAKLPGEVVVLPGHGYSERSSTIAKERRDGLLRPVAEQVWLRRMSR